MTPKFSIGELVIRQAEYYPEGNGEYTVNSVITRQEYEHLYPSPTGWAHMDEIYYGLDGFSVHVGNGHVKIICCHTAQWNLRKRHTGSDYSFTGLMTHMKTKIVENI